MVSLIFRWSTPLNLSDKAANLSDRISKIEVVNNKKTPLVSLIFRGSTTLNLSDKVSKIEEVNNKETPLVSLIFRGSTTLNLSDKTSNF